MFRDLDPYETWIHWTQISITVWNFYLINYFIFIYMKIVIWSPEFFDLFLVPLIIVLLLFFFEVIFSLVAIHLFLRHKRQVLLYFLNRSLFLIPYGALLYSFSMINVFICLVLLIVSIIPIVKELEFRFNFKINVDYFSFDNRLALVYVILYGTLFFTLVLYLLMNSSSIISLFNQFK